MNQKLLKLRAILNELGGYDPLDSLVKAHFQRRIYLLQAFGLPLQYKFLYSSAGPTSTILARDLIHQEFDYDIDLYIRYTNLTPEALHQIQRLQQFEGILPEDNRREYLRAASLIHMLVHQRHWTKGDIERNMITGPQAQVDVDMFTLVWDALQQAGLLKGRKVEMI